MITNGSHTLYACVCVCGAIRWWWCDDVVKSGSDESLTITNGSHTSHTCVCGAIRWWWCDDVVRSWSDDYKRIAYDVCVCACAIGWWCDDVVKSGSDDYKRIACVVFVCVYACVCDRVMMLWCCKIWKWWLQMVRIRRMRVCVCVCAIGWWCDYVL